jgi:HK97 family phage prohead protease
MKKFSSSHDPEAFDPAAPSLPLRRHLSSSAAAPSGAGEAPRHTLDFRSSDATLDRYEEIISVAGWRLENYRRNPVVQNAHSYASLADTIGRSLITEARGDHLFQRVQFAVEENPLAKLAYGLYKGGFLHAVSVGFIPLRWENGSEGAAYRRKFLEQELLEVSAVSIPANPNALALGLKAGAIEKGDLRELAALLKHFCAAGMEANVENAWRRLARELEEVRRVLRKG